MATRRSRAAGFAFCMNRDDSDIPNESSDPSGRKNEVVCVPGLTDPVWMSEKAFVVHLSNISCVLTALLHFNQQ